MLNSLTLDNYKDDSELVLGIVAPLGADIDVHEDAIVDHLKAFGYDSKVIRLSSQLKELADVGIVKETTMHEKPEALRIQSHMDAGNEARSNSVGEILALSAVNVIRAERPDGGKTVARNPLQRKLMYSGL